MKIRSQNHRHRHAHGDELQERGSCLPGDSESERPIQRKGKHQQSDADESPLLSDVTGDEVVIPKRQKSVLLPSATKSHTKYLA